MIANALFATTACFLAIGLFLMGECQFLIPYRQLLWEQYATPIATFRGSDVSSICSPPST